MPLVAVSGVDLDRGMVEHTRAVKLGDGQEGLDVLADSLGVVFAAQVVEQAPPRLRAAQNPPDALDLASSA